MKRLHLVFFIVLSAGILLSCSKDEKDPVVSKIIESIEIWKGNNMQWELNSNLTFTYTAGRLSKFKKDNNEPEVTYAYNSTNNIEYGWHYGSSNYYGMSVQLHNGRAERTESAELGTYRYHYNDGYLVNWDVRLSSMVIAEYRHSWSKGNLEEIENLESDNINNDIYNDTYIASSILNEYNIDLNVLPHFIDKRKDYVEKMNTFGHLIGITGKRSQNFLQSIKYSYEYSYDEYGRLITIVMKEKSDSTGEGYLFKINYNV